MSFSYNPYEHIEIITATSKIGEVVVQGFKIYCHSCGAQLPKNSTFIASTSIAVMFNQMARHLIDSHNRVPADFVGWSKL